MLSASTPVGYFYRKEVQQQIPLNPDNDDQAGPGIPAGSGRLLPGRDQESRSGIRRVHKRHVHQDCPKTAAVGFTGIRRIFLSWIGFWQNGLLNTRREFRARQACGYQVRTNWTIKKAIKDEWADHYYENGGAVVASG